MSPDRKDKDNGNGNGGDGGQSPFGDLKSALGGYLAASGHSLVGKAGKRIGGLTDKLTPGSGDGDGDADKGGSGKGGNGKSGKGKSGGKQGGAGGGSVKATHIFETVDVGVPLRTAYDAWTQIQDFSGFTKGVQSVSPDDEVESNWTVKIAFSTRSWKATVQEQVPDERIVWTSEGAKGSTLGSITFHALAPRLTRIVVVVEYYPSGFFEKTANLWRAQGRRLRLDLKHFVRHVTLMDEEEVEGWRGEIRDGEVVKSHEDAMEEENAEDSGDDGDDDHDDEEDDGEDEEEDEGDEDGEYDDQEEDDEDEYDDEDGDEGDEDDAPPRRRRRR